MIRRRDNNIFRQIRAWYFFKNPVPVTGKNVRVHGFPIRVKIGKNTRFFDNCIFEFGSNSKLTIGDNVVLSFGVVTCCNMEINIGNDVQVGEYSSIRDTTHRHNIADKPMKYLPDISTPVVIGNDVWIGRGCIILPGSYIEDGVVIAANSVVKGRLEKNGIYGGTPAKLLKYREKTDQGKS